MHYFIANIQIQVLLKLINFANIYVEFQDIVNSRSCAKNNCPTSWKDAIPTLIFHLYYKCDHFFAGERKATSSDGISVRIL